MAQNLAQKQLCPRVLRIIKKRLWSVLFNNLALIHKNYTVGDPGRANPISWVTQIIVMPSSASSIIVSSTSLIISGSSAEVGSSNNIIRGFMHNERAMATRCCCPPDNWPGYLSALFGDLYLFKKMHRNFFGFFLGRIANPNWRKRTIFKEYSNAGTRLKC